MIQNNEDQMNSYLTPSQLFPHLFPFLDTSSIHICKLVNKDWNQQITKSFQSQELRLLSELYSLAEDELTPDEISIINQLLLDTSKAIVYLQKSFLYDPKARMRFAELMSMTKPPQKLYNLFYLFVALIDPPNISWKKIDGSDFRTSWIQLYHFGVEEQLRNIQEKLNQPQFLLEINPDRIQKVESFLKERVFEPAELQRVFYQSNFLGFWIVLIIKSIKSRLQLNEKTRNTFDRIYLNTSFEKRKELAKVNRYKEVCNTWIRLKDYEQNMVNYEKRLEALAVRREKNNMELTVLKHAMQDLKIEIQEIQQKSKK